MERFSISWRAVISMLMVFGFVILAVSGILLYVAPHGRAAEWSFMLLNKQDWRNLHIVFSFLFIAISIWHLVLNWKPFTGYIRQRITTNMEKISIKLRPELFIALILCLLLGIASVSF
ncbi:MAG: DUF4405 domain-containing protein [Alphaproteobacteria bacterium]|nr:DUF4405 domain-containing protein [Alphaproteobacteria bacterium]